MSSSTVMKQGIREKCIDWAKSVVDSAISTPPLLSGEHISEHTYMFMGTLRTSFLSHFFHQIVDFS